MLHFLLEIIIMNLSTKTRLLLRDKCKVVHSDRLYRPALDLLHTIHNTNNHSNEVGRNCFFVCKYIA